MTDHRVRRRGLAMAFSSLRADQRPYSPLERFSLNLPWILILIVCLEILAGWSPEQIQALIVCLIPLILVSTETAAGLR